MEVKDRIKNAFREFLAKDIHLLTVKANERSITHHFANYVAAQFPDYNVDCEYNRKDLNPKRLVSFKKNVDSDDTKGVTIFPDVIVHHRGTQNNHVVIEAKTSAYKADCQLNDACRCDRCKLKVIKEELGYKYAFYIVFPVDVALAGYSEETINNFITEI